MGEAGLEPARPYGQGILSPMSGNHKRSNAQELTSMAPERLPASLPDLLQYDPELAAIVAAWPELTDSLKAGIVAMVKAMRPS